MEITERERIKAEIRAELLAELTKSPRQQNRHWEEVKEFIKKSYPHPYQLHQMINGTSAIVRNVYGVKRIADITADQAAAAKEALKLIFKAAGESAK